MRPSFLFRAILVNMLPTTLFAKSFLKYISSRASTFPEWVIQGFVIQVQTYKPNMNKIPVISNSNLSRFPANTLVFIGQDEILYNNSNDVVARIRSVAPHVTVIVVPDAKHMVSLDQPTLVNEKIISFLS
jgi:pimeloyl-ACP methyl ester carboxylesterase